MQNCTLNTDTSRALQPVRLTCKVLILIILSSVVLPVIVHHIGMKSISDIQLSYPGLGGYTQRETPGMEGVRGLDFSQVYLSAHDVRAGKEIYYPVKYKVWRRKWSTTYHPLTTWLYLPLSYLPFKWAFVTHNSLSIALLLFTAYFALRRTQCKGCFPLIASTMLVFLFFTSPGLLHLERGQFDLFTATAYVGVFSLFYSSSVFWAVFTGFISSLKITSWVFITFYWLCGALIIGMNRRMLLLPLTILLLLMLFLFQLDNWLPALLYVEFDHSNYGPSFTRILPRFASKSLPVFSTAIVSASALGMLAKRKSNSSPVTLFGVISFPLAACLTLQAMGFTNVTHDYRLIAFLGLIPCLAIWAATNKEIPQKITHLVSYVFGLSLLPVFRVPPFAHLSYDVVAYCMLGFSFFFLLVALVLLFAFPNRRGEISAAT